MRTEYLAELAKIHEPPEMTDKPMAVRRAAPPGTPLPAGGASRTLMRSVMTPAHSPQRGCI